LDDTYSVNSFYSKPCNANPTDRERWGRGSHRRRRFSGEGFQVVIDGDFSGGLWRGKSSDGIAGIHSKVDGGLGVIGCMLQRRWEVAGGCTALVGFWASIPCRTERDEGVRRRTGEREGRGGQKRVAGYSTVPESAIDDSGIYGATAVPEEEDGLEKKHMTGRPGLAEKKREKKRKAAGEGFPRLLLGCPSRVGPVGLGFTFFVLILFFIFYFVP
jgi:hypothetical protein